jgi:methionyl-tRNA formyltransferase
VHQTTAELDAGPIAARRAVTIADDWDAGDLWSVLAEIGADLVGEVLPEPRFTPQPEDGVTYAAKITAADRELDPSRPAAENVNRVRALSPHVGARAVLNGRPVIVWRARASDGVFEPLEVQPEGRRRMAYDEFVRGLR